MPDLSYEERRRAQIEENQRMLSDLGIEVPAAPTAATGAKRTAQGATRATKRQRTGPARRKAASVASRTRFAKTRVPRRKSPRLQQGAANGALEGSDVGPREEEVSYAEENNDAAEPGKSFENDNDNEESAAALTARYKAWKQTHQALVDMDPSEHDARRRLFLVPTGRVGVNDHTLDHPVKDVDNQHLWGFCEGLFTRIFTHVRPGDIFLMTSSGAGAFNRIARVKETRIVSKAEADRFWQRLSFSMGGTSKNNVGFPLLTPIDKPKSIEWSKDDVMRAFGYSDHLQSSRWIRAEKLYSSRGSQVLQDCLDILGLEPTLTAEEIKLAESCPK
ncbi:Hypothetical Protein FCC1311_078602 [Hondaea fermentalgiana]|uniref:Uncharacterized protein n=1 Tax=Hondaea fermentalgiana TaxID=2315210 RepID=A0A2R5GLY7_9STRA|nr:Hypothetical Protein FCC1311_078602 [Hondaea fermentalgiana]|eukprot:GBG31635.1 Hypothetical Protein FCC1311_078602 [Hondaea fermentalgiana]